MQTTGQNLYMWRIQIWNEMKEAAATCDVRPSERITQAPPPTNNGFMTQISVVDADCIEVAHGLMARGRNPAVLNLSDDCWAGGAIELGSGAQEESLWRRTALCRTQKQEFYPLVSRDSPCALIYSPNMPVLRETERNGYQWLADPFTLSFIACPAIKYPKWVRNNELTIEDKEELERRLRLILDVAAAKGHDAVVLGAMGCGAWKNPPDSVACVFAQVLDGYRGVFREITVAILSTGDQPSPVVGIFGAALNGL